MQRKDSERGGSQIDRAAATTTTTTITKIAETAAHFDQVSARDSGLKGLFVALSICCALQYLRLLLLLNLIELYFLFAVLLFFLFLHLNKLKSAERKWKPAESIKRERNSKRSNVE